MLEAPHILKVLSRMAERFGVALGIWAVSWQSVFFGGQVNDGKSGEWDSWLSKGPGRDPWQIDTRAANHTGKGGSTRGKT